MTVPLTDLVTATELARNTSRYVTEASAGRRIVILHRGAPTAALISIEDLQRLLAGPEEKPPTARSRRR
ncbi:type II toxin-antitoxin system Phd/YefM family antitoxin [Mycolicibacterium peregrinum]|uniref:type II toxin-antitoxin system Phd/YefM family antitoxin n=1 Tax=Mycolicibacterium peregrinum TaxID=43304 RepID=UPI003AAFC8B6